MEKTKEKKTTTGKSVGESDLALVERGKLTEEKEKLDKEQKRLRRKVATLIKKQKQQQAMGIVRGRDDWKPWGQEAQVKVCNVCCIVPMNNTIFFFLCYDIVTAHSRLALV